MTPKTLTLFAALALAPPAFAQAPVETPQACAVVGDLAEAIMDRRQEGLAMSRVMTVVPADEGPARTLVLAMVQDAYDTPRFSTPANQRRAAQDFRNAMEAECFRAIQ
jgi:hypothetical protein